ncbi:MAG TPA: HEPN domain-containing protein [Rhizomicrobium sp.]|nr:HEPN domain-containing protein [Rhizomicrobium sp.]
MTPEAGRYLAKARLTLDHARKMLIVQLNEDAGRAAYLAGFQAAQALIFERTGTVTKTHKGAHTEFARLTRNEPRVDTELRRFLPQAYDLKAVCDYELGPDAVVPHEKAAAAVETAHRFVECISALVDAPGPHA